MKEYNLPYHLMVEEGIFSRIPQAMEDVEPGLSGKKMLLVTEENLKSLFASHIEGILGSFNQSELYLMKEASYDEATDLAKYMAMQEITLVIGLGGGSVLDLAKFAAFVGKVQYICLPTTLSNDSLASPVAVLVTEGKARRSFHCEIPEAIFVDPTIIKSAPRRQILSGIGDTISKYTALNDWKLSWMRGNSGGDDFAYMLSKMALNTILFNDLEDVTGIDFIKLLTQALVMGGLAMEIAGSSRPSSGSEHLFCHALEENYSEQTQVPHGIAVAIGSYGACKLQQRNLEKITRVIKKYGIPVKPSDWKITEEIFVGAWQDAAATRPDRYTILNEADLSDENLKALYHEMEEVFA
ncbi:MAG: iron-containing alcohol dehydrogenase family protein [Lachnospiraceae bacterium]|nr:iron-containing alcohol dehydrogenase family protein [Lachnospiraceae bacterium]